MTATRSHQSPFLHWPSTQQGRHAVTLWAIAVACLVVGIGLAGIWFGLLEPSGGDQESPPIWFLLPMGAAAAAALGTTVAGGIYAAVAIRHGDRSVLLALPVVAFLIAVAFFIGEFSTPH